MAAAETLLGRRVDGLIVVGGSIPDQELEKLKGRVPTLLVGREISDWNEQCLYVDNEQAGYLATVHLIELGHRRIAHIAGLEDHQDAIRRKEGYLRALKEHGIERDDSLIIAGNFDATSGVLAIENLVQSNAVFTAIFAANDMTAMGARLALYRRGIRVPEDVSIIGFDDQDESAFSTPPLTTVKQPGRELGATAVESMINLIAGKEYSVPQFSATITVRESTRMKG